MGLLFISALSALRSLWVPGMFAILCRSLVVTILALIAFIIVMTGLSSWAAQFMTDPILREHAGVLGGLSAAALAWFLFPGIMPLIITFFDERIIGTIEASDYPGAKPAPRPFWPELAHDSRFALIAIGLNILVLPLYMVPVINLFLFYVLNGFLLGREFFMTVARRYLGIPAADALRKTHTRAITLGGIGLSLMATIPLVNLFAPFWGIALMTHLFHTLSPHTRDGVVEGTSVTPR